jgi:hypothetical protein
MAKCELKTNRVIKTTCDSFITGGFCKKDEMFRCPLWIEKNEPRLSHSGITNFLRCPQMYQYSNIRGLQIRREFQSDPLKIGSAVDDYITNILMGGKKTEDSVYFVGKIGPMWKEIKTMWEAKSIGVIKAFQKLINEEAVKKHYVGQKEFNIQFDGQPYVKGFIDLESVTGKSFIELKVGKNPSYYTNLFYIRSKLAAYFMSNENYISGTIWAIRVPEIKRTGKFKNESLEDFSARITRVMVAEPRHYFPGYSHKTRNFGVKFGRGEIDLDITPKYYRMVADWIKLSIKKNVWIKNGTGCLHPFNCDYLDICENNGALSTDVFTTRKKESRKLKIQS